MTEARGGGSLGIYLYFVFGPKGVSEIECCCKGKHDLANDKPPGIGW